MHLENLEKSGIGGFNVNSFFEYGGLPPKDKLTRREVAKFETVSAKKNARVGEWGAQLT